jgi:hypothetical protein
MRVDGRMPCAMRAYSLILPMPIATDASGTPFTFRLEPCQQRLPKLPGHLTMQGSPDSMLSCFLETTG